MLGKDYEEAPNTRTYCLNGAAGLRERRRSFRGGGEGTAGLW